MEDLLVRVNMTELSLLATKIPQTGDINAIFAELKADINGLKTEKEVMMVTIAEFRVIVPHLMIYAFHGISYGIPPICLTFSQRVIIISKLQIRIKF